MTSTFHKIKDLKVTQKLAELGFKEIYSLGKMLVLCTDAEDIQCKLDNTDLTKTTEKYLKKSLDKSTKFTDQEKELICTRVCGILLDSLKQQSKQKEQEKQQCQESTDRILEDIKQLRKQNPNLTYEEWQNGLVERYQVLYDTVKAYLPEIWIGLEFSLSVLRVLNIYRCTLPLIGLLLGRPGSGKTADIRLMKEWYCTYSCDNFTPKAFQSHSTAVSSKEELEEIDMLPRMKNKILLTPELAPTFSGKEEDLAEKLGIITRIADGHGYSSDSGAHGHREYGDTMFTWVGATVDVPKKVFKIMATLGPRLYFFRLPFKDKPKEELLKQELEGEDHNVKEQLIQEALFDYLKWFDIGPTLIRSDDNPIPKIQWDKARDNDDGSMGYIINLAELLSYLRRHVDIYDYGDSDDMGFSASAREDVVRTTAVLHNLAKGHALLKGRNHITLEDVPLVVKTTLSTAQIDRVKVFDLLIASKGKLSSNRIVQSLNMSKPSAAKTMIELKAIGLVDIGESKERAENNLHYREITLREQFNWFLSDEFNKLREGFVPIDHREYMTKGMLKEDQQEATSKQIGHHTHIKNISEDGNGQSAKEDLSWPLYDELERKEQLDPANHMQADKNTVNRKRLHDRLVESGSFTEDEADQRIERMISTGKLKEVMMGTLRRVD